MTTRLVALAAALLFRASTAAWPPGAVRRYFHATPNGQLHYVVRGDVGAAAPLVFFHGHPRSTEEIKDLAAHLPESQPFIAVDYFGAGHSDECQCDESKDEFVSYEDFAGYVLEICDENGVGKMVPFGALTGASPAIELAGLAAEAGRLEKAILFEAYYLKPAAKTYVDTIYIPTIRHMPMFANGSHLTAAWFKPDAGPIGPSSTIPAEEDFARNQQKSVDWFLNVRTGWEYKMAWTAYNDKIPLRLRQIANAGARVLFIYADFADMIGNKYGLDHDWSEAHINRVVPESLRRIERVANGTEGALEQNASLVSTYISDFIGMRHVGEVIV